MVDVKTIRKIAKECGFYETGEIDIASLRFSDEIRHICEGNVCRNYRSTWACPPAVGTIGECRQRCSEYKKMLLLSGKYDLEDSLDFEGMKAGMISFKKMIDLFNDNVKSILSSYIILSNEGCMRCEKCSYPEEPCRFPDKLFHSIEGYGFVVSDLAIQAGIHYINGNNTVTYFGAILFA
jgi:predicted metal-binding protein